MMPAALLERVGRGVRPTAAGLLLTGYADVIGRQVAEAETALADLVAGRTGRLTVRYFATAGAVLVAPDVAVRPVRNPEPTRTIPRGRPGYRAPATALGGVPEGTGKRGDQQPPLGARGTA